MTDPRGRPTATALRAALLDARSVELQLLDDLTDAQMLGTRDHFLEPPIWEMGHVGWFQEHWILGHLDGRASLLPGSDAIYDAFNVPYSQRWDHRYPSRRQTVEYISAVLDRSVARLDSREPSAEESYFYTLAALHEDMHTENLTLILHTLGYPRPRLARIDPGAARPALDPAYRPRDVAVPGGAFALGATPDESFVFDNEKWAHPVEVRPFRPGQAGTGGGRSGNGAPGSGAAGRAPNTRCSGSTATTAAGGSGVSTRWCRSSLGIPSCT